MTLPIKISLFSFLSAIVCLIGYWFLGFELLYVITDILWFFAYVAFFAWICQTGYEKKKISINLTITIMSLTTAIYMGVYSGLTSNEFFVDYCIYAFYLLFIVCIISTIIWIGRLIFRPTPKKNDKGAQSEKEEKKQAEDS